MRTIFYQILDAYNGILAIHYVKKLKKHLADKDFDRAMENQKKALEHLRSHQKICKYFGIKDDTEEVIRLLNDLVSYN